MTDVQPLRTTEWAVPTSTGLPPWAGGEVPQWEFSESDFVPSEPYHDRPHDGRLARVLAPFALVLAVALVAALLCWGV